MCFTTRGSGGTAHTCSGMSSKPAWALGVALHGLLDMLECSGSLSGSYM